ncbi:MAG: hypothetical protein ACP5GO_05870 [Thermoprotei archaeon]
MQREVALATYLPRQVVYFDGTSNKLPSKYVLTEGNLRLFVPKGKIEDVVRALNHSGFENVSLEFYKGEKYSLSLKLHNIWELHVRIYEDGFMDAHFEVSREYFEHLQYESVPAIYEVYTYYMSMYSKLHIFDNKAKKWIKEVKNYYFIKLRPPASLTEWKPIVIAGIFVIATVAYALLQPDKGKD